MLSYLSVLPKLVALEVFDIFKLIHFANLTTMLSVFIFKQITVERGVVFMLHAKSQCLRLQHSPPAFSTNMYLLRIKCLSLVLNCV